MLVYAHTLLVEEKVDKSENGISVSDNWLSGTMAYKGHAANIKETTQIKKKTRKQKRKHANKKENTQIKKKPRK